MDRQQLNISQLLAKMWSHGQPYSCELGKQAYNAACRGNWWSSSSMHISFTRLDLKQETTTDIWMQQISRSGKRRTLLPTPPQPVVLDNSPYHCLQVDRPLSTCIAKTGIIWLCRKSIVSDETMSKNDLPVNSSIEMQRDINKIYCILANHSHAVWLPPYMCPKPIELTWA